MSAVGTAPGRLAIHYFACGPPMDSRPCPGAIMSVDVHQRARRGYVRPHHAAPRPVQALGEISDEGPVSGAHVVREPDCISELILQGSDRPVDLNVFAVAVLTPGVVSVDIPASSQRCAQAFHPAPLSGISRLTMPLSGNAATACRRASDLWGLSKAAPKPNTTRSTDATTALNQSASSSGCATT